MSTIKGLGLFDVEPQPGFTATRDENGGWTGRHSFAIRRTAWENSAVRSQFAKGVSITAIDSGLPFFWSFLKVVSHEVSSEEGDLTMVSVNLSGAQGATYGGSEGTAEDPTYRLSGQLQDAPLSMHPKWEPLTDEQKTALGHLINGILVFDEGQGKICNINPEAATTEDFFDPFLPYDSIITGDALEFAKVIARGETTYLRPVITWTESAQGTEGLTNAQLNKLGNISIPRGEPPEAAGTRDWMLTSAFQEQRGELITTDLEWTLSEKGGHDEFLYDETA